MKLLQLENNSIPQRVCFSNQKLNQATKKVQLKKHVYHKSFYEFARSTNINLSAADERLNNKLNEFKSRLASFLNNKDPIVKSAKCTCTDYFPQNEAKGANQCRNKRSSLH
jgi:hypothetical protein